MVLPERPPADAHDAGLEGADLAASPPADAHDAGLDVAVVPESFQLLLIFWLGWGGSAGKPPADAHDAGLEWASLAESPQLMLMMLAWMWQFVPESFQLLLIFWFGWGGSAGKPPADAHDAGLEWASLAESPQLMLMMLAWMGRFCRKSPQMMLMMLAWIGRFFESLQLMLMVLRIWRKAPS